MIKYLSIENFHSVNTEQSIDFTLGINNESPCKVQPVIGFAGSNASGKTNTLRALGFLRWVTTKSFTESVKLKDLPVEPFKTNIGLPSKLTIDFETIDGTAYEYSIVLSSTQIIEEALYILIENDYQFVYKRTNKEIEFGKSAIPLDKELVNDLGDKVALIAYFSKFESSQNHAVKVYNYFQSIFVNITVKGHTNIVFHPGILVALEKKYKNQTTHILKYADTGIKDFSTKSETNLGSISLKAEFTHRIMGQIVSFDEKPQSSGTKQLLALLYHVFNALEEGIPLIVDEIELQIHPDIIAYIIGLFQNLDENPKGAQLIFTFHNSAFMDILEPEQLWFAEKNKNGETELFAAAMFEDIKELHQKSLQRLYRAGRFGAIPHISFITKTLPQ